MKASGEIREINGMEKGIIMNYELHYINLGNNQ